MMSTITGILHSAYILLNEMSPYLLFGFLFAGILHIFIDTRMVSRNLGKQNLLSVVKASLFGIPLPLCSCSVIPTAMSLRKEGASKGAVLSFLISTPTTGVDSIFATYSLLGGLFTVYRILASFVTGVFAGVLANLFLKEKTGPNNKEDDHCKLCAHGEEGHKHKLSDKIKGVFGYAFGNLLRDTGKPLLLGIFIGGLISYFMPDDFLSKYLGSDLKAMFVMLLVGIPMYVCATASIPIAAALMLKGMNPGAAFVFLVAGPATNIVTMSVIAKKIGKGVLLIYLGAIAAGSLTLGALLDKIYVLFYKIDKAGFLMQGHVGLPGPLSMASSIILVILILYSYLSSQQGQEGTCE